MLNPNSTDKVTEAPLPTGNSTDEAVVQRLQRGLYMISTEPHPPWLTDEVIERSFVALQLERKLESQQRKELLLQDPDLKEWAAAQPEEYWTTLTQSWVPWYWDKKVASGEFNTPTQE